MTTVKRLTSLLVVIVLVFGSIPALAYSPVLPSGEVLSAEQLDKVEGEGPAAAALAGAIGFITGGVGGAVSYGVEYAVDKYYNKSDPTFDGDELVKRVAVGSITGGTVGFIGGLLSPTP